jgi:hypothetical protein
MASLISQDQFNRLSSNLVCAFSVYVIIVCIRMNSKFSSFQIFLVRERKKPQKIVCFQDALNLLILNILIF